MDDDDDDGDVEFISDSEVTLSWNIFMSIPVIYRKLMTAERLLLLMVQKIWMIERAQIF